MSDAQSYHNMFIIQEAAKIFVMEADDTNTISHEVSINIKHFESQSYQFSTSHMDSYSL